MQIDTDKILTTAEASERLGEKQSDLLAHVRNYPHLMPPRYGRLYLWTAEIVEKIHRHMNDRKAGICSHCKKPWDRPTPEVAE